jgi:hypothetical protein
MNVEWIVMVVQLVVVMSAWPADTVMARMIKKIITRKHAFWSKAKEAILVIEDVSFVGKLVVELYVECWKCS